MPNSITAGNDYKAVLTQHTNNSHIFVAEVGPEERDNLDKILIGLRGILNSGICTMALFILYKLTPLSQISDVQIAKQEGKWACNFVYPRYSSPALTRTINKVLYLDATGW